jgi:hypothetical protein
LLAVVNRVTNAVKLPRHGNISRRLSSTAGRLVLVPLKVRRLLPPVDDDDDDV